MKKLIIPLLFILLLSSCNFFNQNIENSKNNSGNIVSENSSQTSADNSQAKENSEEKNLSTEYEVISEKAYFYTNPDDTEARKAYVMKGDKIIVNNEKSTENMIFAIYTNSSGKTTEGYLKKSEIKAIVPEKVSQNTKKKEDNLQISNCKRTYDFAIGHNYEVETYRQFEFNFLGDCIKQKDSIQIDTLFDDGFKVEGGYQSFFTNYLMKIDAYGGPGGCFIKTEKKSKKFKNNNFEISIKGGDEVCYDGYSYDEISEGKKQIFIEIKENNKQLIDIMLIKISSQDFEKHYNDLLWTMENGFFETGKKFS